MAKVSKLEDYWRQHCIEGLFKELTQILARRMPPDPAIAIVEHIQKKYPKSFKMPPDTVGIVPQMLANSLQLHLITSPTSDIHNESAIDTKVERRSSTQSQASGPIAIPTVGSAFTELSKQDANSSKQMSAFNIKNLVFVNQLSQQVVRFRKDIRSDHDVLEEELIKPNAIKLNLSASSSSSTVQATNLSMDSAPENFQYTEIHQEPHATQLIKYKQHIHIEHDRRLHREKLADLARSQREKEQFFSLDNSLQPSEDISQQQKQSYRLYKDSISPHVVPAATNIDNLLDKPYIKSKQEEEILEDENIFQPRRRRGHNGGRYRNRNKLMNTLTNTSNTRQRSARYCQTSTQQDNEGLVCKACGNVMSTRENQSMINTQPLSITPISHALESEISAPSIQKQKDVLDDWFESGLSNSRQSTPVPASDMLLSKIGATTFRRDLFRPINDNEHDMVENQSSMRSSISSNSEAKNKRFKTPHISESGTFTRSSPERNNRSPWQSQAVRSPVAMVHQHDTDHASGRKSANIQIQNTSTQSNELLNSAIQMNSSMDRRISGWSVREPSPDANDKK